MNQILRNFCEAHLLHKNFVALGMVLCYGFCRQNGLTVHYFVHKLIHVCSSINKRSSMQQNALENQQRRRIFLHTVLSSHTAVVEEPESEISSGQVGQ